MIPHLRFIGVPIVVATLIVTLSACSGGPKRQLRMNLPPGSAYELSFRSHVDLTMGKSGGGERPSGSFDSTTRLLCRVASIYENGDMLANITIEEIGTTLALAPRIRSLAGAEFSARISPLGEVVEVMGTSEMRDALRAKSSKGEVASVENYISTQLSDDQLRLPLEFALWVWPAVPVSVDDVWESGQIYDPTNDVYINRTFKLEVWDPAMVTVSFELTMSPADRQPGMHFSGSGSGEIRMSPIEGTIKSARYTRTYSGMATPSPDGPIQIDGQGTYQIEFVPR